MQIKVRNKAGGGKKKFPESQPELMKKLLDAYA